ncbi:MAG: hypothetical protein R3B91_10230 [Planctomycetaceae bacterium]
MMIRIPGQPGKDLCDSHLGVSRRDVLRVGGSSMLGVVAGVDAPVAVLPRRRKASLVPGMGQGEERGPRLSPGGLSYLDFVGPQGERAGQRQVGVQHHRH